MILNNRKGKKPSVESSNLFFHAGRSEKEQKKNDCIEGLAKETEGKMKL